MLCDILIHLRLCDAIDFISLKYSAKESNALFSCQHVLFWLQFLLSLCCCKYSVLNYTTTEVWFVNRPRVAEIDFSYAWGVLSLYVFVYCIQSFNSWECDYDVRFSNSVWDFLKINKTNIYIFFNCVIQYTLIFLASRFRHSFRFPKRRRCCR